MSHRSLIGLLGLIALVGSGSAYANIVVNGGFEISPDVTIAPFGYTQSGNPYYTGISIGAAHSGQAAYDFGGSQSLGLGFLTQALPTVVGQAYALSYYLLIPGGSSTEFLVNVGGDASSGTLVGGQTLMDLIDPSSSEVNVDDYPSNFALETATFTATSSSTNLNFGAYNNPSFFLLDDISVNAVPLPAAAPMFGVGLLVLGAIGYGSKRKAASPAS